MFQAQDLLSLDLNVGRLTLGTTERLMHMDSGIR
jgi:hypothetical protein